MKDKLEYPYDKKPLHITPSGNFSVGPFDYVPEKSLESFALKRIFPDVAFAVMK